MKKLALLLFVCTISFAGFSQVQRKIVKDTMVKIPADGKLTKKQRMSEAGLSGSQMQKMMELKKANKAAKDAIKNDPTLTPEQKEAKTRALKQDYKKQVDAVITPDEKARLKEMKKNQDKQKQ